MKAVIPAAGRGSRLQSLTDDQPKALVEVGGRPLIEHVFDSLIDLDIQEFIVVVGYLKEQIIDRYGAVYRGTPITYVPQPKLLGLAHALRQAEPYVDDHFVLMLGDNVFDANLDAVIDQHRSGNAAATVLVDRVPIEEASRYGVCTLDNADYVIDLVEKPEDPPSNVVMTGFYVISPTIFHACHLIQPSDRGEYELPDAVRLLLQTGRQIETVPLDGWRVDVGYPEDRDRAERLLQGAGQPPQR